MFSKVKIIFMDIDGVFTDCSLSGGADAPRIWNVRDRLAVKILKRFSPDIKVFWISARQGGDTRTVAEELGVDEVFTGVKNKKTVMQSVIEKEGMSLDDALYMGDDLVDISCVSAAGVGCCPADAVNEVKLAADYICDTSGGRGAVREIVEHIMKSAGTWDKAVQFFLKEGDL